MSLPTCGGAFDRSHEHPRVRALGRGDPIHNQIYVPIPSNAFQTGMTGICSGCGVAGASDTNGCIAVFTPVGSDI
jgi:hypothetical protein